MQAAQAALLAGVTASQDCKKAALYALTGRIVCIGFIIVDEFEARSSYPRRLEILQQVGTKNTAPRAAKFENASRSALPRFLIT